VASAIRVHHVHDDGQRLVVENGIYRRLKSEAVDSAAFVEKIASHLLSEKPEVTYTPGVADEEDKSDSDSDDSDAEAPEEGEESQESSGADGGACQCLKCVHKRARLPDGTYQRRCKNCGSQNQDVLRLQCATLSVRRVPFR
jgi:hypothetical protein